MFPRVIMIVLAFSFVFGARAAAQGTHSVSGRIRFHENGKIHVLIVPRDGFGEKTGDRGLVLDVGPAEKKAGRVAFAFHNLPPDDYAIQAFQDENGNGELDTGTFGPKEPWGFYKDVRPTFRGPKWEEVKFRVDKDLTNIQMEVK